MPTARLTRQNNRLRATEMTRNTFIAVTRYRSGRSTVIGREEDVMLANQSVAMKVVRSLSPIIILPGFFCVVLPLVLNRFLFRIALGSPIHLSPLIIVAAAFLMIAYCQAVFWIHGDGTFAPWDPPARLVIYGPYRYVKNPIYVSVVLILLSYAAMYKSLWLLAYAVVFFAYINTVDFVVEEPILRNKFGADYADYGRQVKRWIPRLRPYAGATSHRN
jgi:protein-S-isoprenylcysteine O-methyltransferase Ste14